MIDYLLKFPSKEVAEQFGLANGFAHLDEESGAVTSSLASHTHALLEIGEHYTPDGTGDGLYWVMFRDLVDLPVPEGGQAFIHWSSAGGDPRPVNDQTPSVFWA